MGSPAPPAAGRAWAIVAAAGSGERLGCREPKAFHPVAGVPMLERVLDVVSRVALDGIVVVVPAGWEESARASVGRRFARAVVVAGGASRRESVRLGLGAVAEDAEAVVVHDASRPLVSPDLIERALAALAGASGAVCAVPVVDTLKRVEGDRIAGTVPREWLWRAQTPQAFRAAALREAHARAAAEGIEATDDSALVERCGEPVVVVQGEERNMKITTAADLALAEALLGPREFGGAAGGLA
ncbi:MAG: 2-C-methyl-D-erythritol 4-phosphate cytidylyltransferase [Acidobacteria bacterium]|nr:2-C-methyl-D-erythritol 4-phosphate cytidylyltransferase [Acidobacteriota bacterium]